MGEAGALHPNLGSRSRSSNIAAATSSSLPPYDEKGDGGSIEIGLAGGKVMMASSLEAE